MSLDTSFLVDVLRGDEAVVVWERELAEAEAPVVTSITAMELWEGVQLADASDAERGRVRELLAGLTHAAFDHESAMVAGERSAALASDGAPIEVENVMIAAVALARGEPALTRNPAHFEHFPGLTVETY